MPLAIGALLVAAAAVIAEILLCLVIALVIVLLVFIVYKIIEAIIDYARTPTLDKTWDTAEPVAVPWPHNGLEKIDPKVLDKTKEILKTIAETQALTRGPWNVYDVHITNSNLPFLNYVPERGTVGGRILLPLGDIYRFGKTMKETVLGRYEAAERYPETTNSNSRDRHVLLCLRTARMGATQWYLYRYNIAVANAMETSLIVGYEALHNDHVRPAGNMNYH